MYQQSAMTFVAFIMLLAFATLPASSSAHPISRREYGTAQVAVPIISDTQGSAPTPTPTPATTTTNIIPPRDHESLPSDLASSATDKETESPSEASSSSSPEETQSEESDQDDEHSGLHPNAIAGIAVGVFFGVLLLIAAFMWAFRVGWEKGQMQKEEKEREMAEANLQKPPADTAPQQSWQLVDDCIPTRPPSALIINTTGSSCWDGGSWDCCDEHAENHRILGERYSFRPGMGVYEITDLEANTPRESIRTDSGLGAESLRKAKGKEPERPNSPPASA